MAARFHAYPAPPVPPRGQGGDAIEDLREHRIQIRSMPGL
jgi:hypothetical protein